MQLFAQPYNIDASGFYFESFEDFEDKQSKHVDKIGYPVSEYEIQFIDGNTDEQMLFKAFGVNQSNLDQYFEALETFADYEILAFYALTEVLSYSPESALDKIKDVCLFEGTVLEYAHDLIDDCYDLDAMMGSLANYFDYESFARDLELGGDVSTFDYDGTQYLITNANCI